MVQEFISNTHRLITNSLVLVFGIVSFFISLGIIVIHQRRNFLRQNFFKVIFSLSIYETLFYCFLIVNSILLIFEFSNRILLIIFSVFINFLSTTIFTYNFLILLYLFSISNSKDTLIDKELENDSPSRMSINLMTHSFRYMDIISPIIGLIHAAINGGCQLYGIFLSSLYYVGFPSHNNNWKILLFFIPNLIFFLTSLPYFFSSCNKEKISDKIKLKRYSIYCLIYSFLWCVFPLEVALSYIEFKDNNTKYVAFSYIITLTLCFIMLFTCHYRLSCYYINYILQVNGSSWCKMLKQLFKILFVREKIPELNFVDFNSAFIYHTLATSGDFIDERSSGIDLGDLSRESQMPFPSE